MDTRLLRTFATVARAESLTAAAERLHLVQSTVTAQAQVLRRNSACACSTDCRAEWCSPAPDAR
ncbi:LysR family transcriptional regulator [Streptomyces zhihengii]